MQIVGNGLEFEIGVIASFIPLVIGLIVRLVFYDFQQPRRKAKADWRTVEGEVQYARMATNKHGHPTRCAVITYSYFLNEYQSGDSMKDFSRKQAADEFVKNLRGKKVTVHCHPRSVHIYLEDGRAGKASSRETGESFRPLTLSLRSSRADARAMFHPIRLL